jgi:hypothetical protein
MNTNTNIILQLVVVRRVNRMRRSPGLSVEELTDGCPTRRDSPPYEQLDVHIQRAHPTVARLGVSFRVIVNIKSKCLFTEQAPKAYAIGLSGADKGGMPIRGAMHHQLRYNSASPDRLGPAPRRLPPGHIDDSGR